MAELPPTVTAAQVQNDLTRIRNQLADVLDRVERRCGDLNKTALALLQLAEEARGELIVQRRMIAVSLAAASEILRQAPAAPVAESPVPGSVDGYVDLTHIGAPKVDADRHAEPAGPTAQADQPPPDPLTRLKAEFAAFAELNGIKENIEELTNDSRSQDWLLQKMRQARNNIRTVFQGLLDALQADGQEPTRLFQGAADTIYNHSLTVLHDILVRDLKTVSKELRSRIWSCLNEIAEWTQRYGSGYEEIKLKSDTLTPPSNVPRDVLDWYYSVREMNSDQPRYTILEVIAPGYVRRTAKGVELLLRPKLRIANP